MIAAMTALGIYIPKSDPSSDKEDGEDRKMAAKKKNSNLTKTIRGGNEGPGGCPVTALLLHWSKQLSELVDRVTLIRSQLNLTHMQTPVY